MEKTKTKNPKTKDLLRGLELAYEKMVEFKKYKKTPLVVSRDGEVVEIPWDEIEPTTTYE
ncbi:hypothetical protein [Nonlabens antarcticus]|uniref:hypothetical protein n=1 Tax=Nonlabens antarcticus TaxID=392714 RepID=UPI0018915327|nr:hypothetical protein [Nonlabens antarcticus]